MAEEYNSPYPFHPESVGFIELKKKANLRPYHEMESAAAAREQGRKAIPILTGHVDYAGTREELFVPSPHVKGEWMCNHLD